MAFNINSTTILHSKFSMLENKDNKFGKMRVLAAELHGSSLDMEKTGNTDNAQNVRKIKVIG